MTEDQFNAALAEFVGAFEVVFRDDWNYAKTMIGDEAQSACFIEPGLEDETEDWGVRAALLEKCSALVMAMKATGMKPVFPFPLERLPGFNK